MPAEEHEGAPVEDVEAGLELLGHVEAALPEATPPLLPSSKATVVAALAVVVSLPAGRRREGVGGGGGQEHRLRRIRDERASVWDRN